MTHGPHRWRKSSHSNQGVSCVELAANMAEIRDSKNPDATLRVDVAPLLIEIKTGNLGR
jgi:hypothetical protein